jgi:PAS domain S-box-containing protein
VRQDPQAFDTQAAVTKQRPGGIAHEAGALHRLLVESVDEYAIFALDPEGYILSWNPGAERFKGYRAEEVIGKHFSIFYLPERIAEGFPEFELREAARLGRFTDEGWRLRKDGTRFWAYVVITALRASTGELVGYAKVTRDLTERRDAEEALRESEKRFRLLVQSVKDYAIFMLDENGYVATWNEGAERIKGYTASEIIGQHFSKFYSEEDIASGKPPRELEIASSTGQYEEEGWRLRKDGSRIWASVLITALRNDDGRLVGFAKVTRDLTERRAAQEQLLADARLVAAEEAARHAADVARARTEKLQTLTAALSAAHTVPEITQVIFTQAFPELGAAAGALGLVDDADDRIKFVGDNGFSALPTWVRDVGIDDDTPLSTAIRTGKPVVCRSRDERNERFPKLAEVLAPFGAMVVLPLAVRDRIIGALSMHRRPEQPLTEDVSDMMHTFALRVAQAIERAALYEAEQHARARADEANRAKSEFLAAMSHELRTPLNAIGGYADLLDMGLRGPVTPEQHEDLQRIRRSQKHLLAVINDILNFARIEAGQVAYTYQPVVIFDVVEAVAQMIAPLAAAKGLRLTVGECPPDVTAWADKSKVEQIIVNLLSNAVKFTTNGEITLTCDYENPTRVAICVRDTGSGIADDQLDKIFEPFVQVGRSLTNSREGTGLGLAISRDLARAMSGEIAVGSETGCGSTFTLTLPRTSRKSGAVESSGHEAS